MYNIGKKRDLISHEKGVKLHIGDLSTLKGYPNSNRDVYRSHTGCIHKRRKFDENGNAYKDLDFSDDTHNYDHVHDFVDSKHLIGRKPTKKEKSEMKKARQKVVFFDGKTWGRRKVKKN